MTNLVQPDATSVARYDRGAWLFALAFALLLSHELDAMIRAEWQLLPGLSALDSDTAADVFNLIHVPVLAPIIWALTTGSASTRRRTMLGIEGFVVVHALVHAATRGADRYEFAAPVETITVYGAAVAAGIHLAHLGQLPRDQPAGG